MNLKGRNFLTLKDFTPEEILYMVDLAAELKDKKKKGILTTEFQKSNRNFLSDSVTSPLFIMRLLALYMLFKVNSLEEFLPRLSFSLSVNWSKNGIWDITFFVATAKSSRES